MVFETVKMSSKGQIVIPQHIRQEIHAQEGSIFAVIGSKDSVILKKIETPSRDQLLKEFQNIAIAGRKRAEKLGLRERDVSELVQRIRRERRA